MNQGESAPSCDRVVTEMAGVLDGSAPTELLEHAASCDTCRDARYDAERAEVLMTEAGSDFAVPEGFATRLRAPVAELRAPSSELRVADAELRAASSELR